MPAKENQRTQFYPAPGARQSVPPPARPARRGGWLLWLLLPALFLAAVIIGVLAGGLSFVYARERILPGVSALGAPLSGRTTAEAAAALQSQWDAQTISLQNGETAWPVGPAALGLALDANATAEAAAAKGRSLDSLRAILGEGAAWFDTPPVWRFDPAAARQTLADLAPRLAVAAVDAGVRVNGGRAEVIPAVEGRELDIEATLAALAADPAGVLAARQLALVTRPVPAAVSDVSAAVDEANRMLATTVTLEVYDPVRDERFAWPVASAVWGEWLRLAVDPAAADPFTWSLDRQIGVAFLDTLEAQMGDGRYLDEDATLAALSDAIQSQSATAATRVRHPERRHTVQPGETLSSIGYDYGIPYPWLQQLNPSVDALTVGQEIAIPAADALLPLPPVPNKRIVVSLSEQRTQVYENGQLKWDWPSSTGIASSPTAPGIFQVQSHEPNAYAGNWDLWMPSFMGIYRPVPTSDFMNGFHGFPTRGNSQLLWTGDLGHPVTYGCILLSSENAALLYEWAEEGVVVEVTR
jgi:lipoprotein-anchoring transpeptidase ErfK/SrfK